MRSWLLFFLTKHAFVCGYVSIIIQHIDTEIKGTVKVCKVCPCWERPQEFVNNFGYEYCMTTILSSFCCIPWGGSTRHFRGRTQHGQTLVLSCTWTYMHVHVHVQCRWCHLIWGQMNKSWRHLTFVWMTSTPLTSRSFMGLSNLPWPTWLR